jgi:hypothetical protein
MCWSVCHQVADLFFDLTDYHFLKQVNVSGVSRLRLTTSMEQSSTVLQTVIHITVGKRMAIGDMPPEA